MKLASLFSGGKDSTLALYESSKSHSLKCLITLISKNPDSYMYHTPNIHLTKKQAFLMNLPIIQKTTLGKKESELKDLKAAIQEAIKKYQIQGIVTGAVASNYQLSRIKKICNELGLKCLNPLWHRNQIQLLKDLIKNRFEVIIIQIASDGLDESWLGKEINEKTIEKLKHLNKKYGINEAGEGGEYESLVIKCPLFSRKLKILKSEKVINNPYTGYLKIKKVK